MPTQIELDQLTHLTILIGGLILEDEESVRQPETSKDLSSLPVLRDGKQGL
jgi:hypothetical protein